MKPLKTKYPCVKCGEPAEVVRKKDAERAKCTRCRERDRLVSVSASKDMRANNCAPINPEEPRLAGLARWLEAVEARAGAAAAIIRAAEVAHPRERRLLARAARERLQWVVRAARKIDEGVFPAALLETPGLEAIDGGGERALVYADLPALRLVRGGDEP